MKRFAAAVALAFVTVAASFSPASAETLPPNRYFTLKDLQGKDVSLAETMKGKKAVLLNFWATWCPPCREEIPDLIRLQEKYKDKGFTVIGIDIAESQRKVSKFVQKNGVTYPVVLDSDRKVMQAFKVVGIPTSWLVASDGTILGEFHAAGPDLFEAVEKAVR